MATLIPTPYKPTASRGGNEGLFIFRMKNFLLRGEDNQQPYLEVYSGSLNLSETIPGAALTGTVAVTAAGYVATGTGTAFTTELHPGQFVYLHDPGGPRGWLLLVEIITDNTHFTYAKLTGTTISGLTATRMPGIFELGKNRGTQLHGNAFEFDKGTILSVGDGTLRRNGAVLPGVSLVHTNRKPKIAIYNPGTGNFAVYSLGMTMAAAPVLTGVGGGVKNMQAGNYSILAFPARHETNGYNNSFGKALGTLAADGDRFRIANPVPDTANGQSAWIYYGTRYNSAVSQAENGPWYKIQLVKISDLTDLDADAVADDYYLEWLDAEIQVNELATFDNDIPSDAEMLGVLEGYPIYVSCQGPGSTSPGPMLIPAKPRNIEAAPLKYATALSPPEPIIGAVSALARLYCMTPNTLQIAQTTSNPAAPLITRPFWKVGFNNRYGLCFVNGYLYGATNSGPMRSVADAEEGSEEKRFALYVEELTKLWTKAHGLVAHDPINDAVCFFHSADHLNGAGYWTTRVLVLGLRQQAWIGDIIIESQTRDMIVCGVATVNGKLEFLAGGRTSGGAVTIDTFRFDEGTGSAVDYYVAWGFMDEGEEHRDKWIRSIKVTGKLTNATAGIHGYGPGEEADVTTLETGNSGSKSGSIDLGTLATVQETAMIDLSVTEIHKWTTRIDGTWSGSGAKDRIEEVVCQVEITGARR